MSRIELYKLCRQSKEHFWQSSLITDQHKENELYKKLLKYNLLKGGYAVVPTNKIWEWSLSSKIPIDMNRIFMKLHVTWPMGKVTYLRNLNFRNDFCSFWRILFLIRLKILEGGTLATMPVKYFAPKVTVKLCIINFSVSR